MGRTLLIGNPAVTWREWEKEQRGKGDWICLDPADPNHGTPAQFSLWRADKPLHRRFYGSLDPQRFPHVVLAALAELLSLAAEEATVQLFPYRPGPVLRHLAVLAAQMIQPARIVIAKGTELDLGGWPVGPEECEVAKALPLVVEAAQRKAHWLKLVEDCSEHQVDLRQVAIEGARLGTGTALTPGQVGKTGVPSVVYGEVCGTTLLLVADEPVDDDALSRSLAVYHCSRAHIMSTTDCNDLLCSFVRQGGEDFGIGMVQRIDFGARTAEVLCTAVAPAPVRILRLGALRVDRQGRELGEVRPWQV